MAGRKSTRRLSAPMNGNTDPTSTDVKLILAIEAQRRRVFQVSAIAACLGHALEDVCAPGQLAPELQNVTDVMIRILDDAAAGLDPSALNLQSTPALDDQAARTS
jgi:hypothetical protein